MSKQVDERVVSMEFDSKRFEQNVNSTIGIIDKLEKSLRLKGAEKGFENVDSAAKKVDMSPLSSSVENVGLKFNALFTIADQALRNITNSAMNTGKKVISALAIDPIKTGFQEYETQINSVQTILANTESKGSTLQDVNAALAELNTYADKTIYNFTEMTRNIGTFTAAGVDLKTSVSAIKGIANLAAVSGSTSQQASTAMYQLSQALSSGTVKLMDWNSVVNAGMGGQVFQDALKETARVHKVNIDAMIKKNGSFRETLQEGWLTSEILTETLSKFTGDLSEAQLKSMGYTDEQIKSIVKMGKTANDAATKVKTFTQLFDTLKEAAQSGWTKSWELLIGDFGEAKELLTEISDLVGGIIGDSGDKRNEMLMGGLATGWKQLLNEGINDAAGFEEMVSNVAKEHGVDIASMINEETSFQDVLKKSLKEGTLTSDVLGESITKFNDKVSKMSSAELEAAGYTKDHVAQLKELNDKVQNGTISMDEFAKLIVRPSGRELLIESLWNTIKGLQSVLTPVKQALEEVFPAMTGEQLYKLIEGIRDFTAKLALSDEQAGKVKATFKGVFSVIKVGVDIVKSIASGCVKLIGAILPMGNGLLDASASLGGFLTGLSEAAGKVINLDSIFDSLANILRTVSTGIGSVFSSLAGGIDKCGGFIGILKGLVDWIGQLFDKVTVAMPGNSIFDTLFNFINSGIFAAIGVWIAKLIKGFSEITDNAGGFLESITDILGGVGDALDGFTKTLKAKAIKDIAIALGILAVSLFVLASIDPGRLTTVLLGMGVLLKGFMMTLTSLDKLGDAGKFKGIGKLTLSMISISTALLILSAALKIMGSMSWQEMAIGLGGMVVGLSALVMALNKLPEKDVNSAAKTIKKLSGSLVIFAIALKIMGSMSWQEMAIGLGGVVVGLTALVIALNKLPEDAGKSKGVIALSMSLLILSAALKIMGSMSWQEMALGLGGMVVGLSALVIALNKLPKDVTVKAGGIMTLSLAMIALGGAFKIFSSMSWEELGKGIASIAASLLVLVFALHKIPDGSKVGSILLLASSMVVLGAAFKIFASMSWEELGKGIASIAATLFVLGVAGYVLAPVSGVLLAIGGAVALLGVGCLAAGAGLTLLATGLTALAAAIVGSVGIILAGANELVGVFTTIILSLVTAIVTCVPAITNGLLQLLVSVIAGLAQYTPQLVNSLFDFIIGLLDAIALRLPELIQSGVNLFMSFFQGVVQALGTVDTTTLIQGITAVGLIAGLIVALSAITPFIPGAMVAVLGIGVLVAELGLVLAAIGALAQIPGLEWLIGEGGDFLQTVGTAIGQFLGGIVGGIAEGMSSALPEIGSNLSAFMINATPFITGAQAINPSTLEGVKSLAEIILLLTAADILDGLTSWLTGGSSMVKFGEQLTEFGPYIAAFAESVKGIDAQAVTAASSSAKMLAEMADSIPSDWGHNNVTKFGEQLENFAASIVSFSDIIGGKTGSIKSAVTAAKEAIDSLSSMTSSNTMAIETFSKTLSDIAQNGINGFVSAFSDAGTIMGVTISTFINTVSTQLTNQQKTIYENFKSVGSYVVDGFIKGIDENTFKVEAQSVAMAKAALEAAKEALGIHSPSIVFNKEVGRYIVQGVAEGIKKDMSAEEAAEKKAQNIVNAFKKVFDRNDLYSSINDNELELWKNKEGLLASKSEIDAKEIEYYTKNLTYSLDNQSKAYDKWKEMVNYFGETSDEAKEAWNEYREYQLKVAQDQNNIGKKKAESGLTSIEDDIDGLERTMSKTDSEYNKWLSTAGRYASDNILYESAMAKLTADELNSANMLDLYKQSLEVWKNMPEGVYAKEELVEKIYEAEQDVAEWEQKLIDIRNEKLNTADQYKAEELNEFAEERARSDEELSLWLKTDGRYVDDAVQDSKIIATHQNNLLSIQTEINRREKELAQKIKEQRISEEEIKSEQDKIAQLKSDEVDTRRLIEDVYQEQIDEQIEAYDLTKSNLDLQYQIWEKGVGRNATVAEKNIAKVAMLTQQLSSQSSILQIARDEWGKAEREYGKNSDEAQAAYNKYLQEELELANLQSEITDINESTIERQKAAEKDYNDYIKNYEKFYEMNGMSRSELLNDAKLVSGFDGNATVGSMISTANNALKNLPSNTEYAELLNNFSTVGTSYVSAINEGLQTEEPVVVASVMSMLEQCLTEVNNYKTEWIEAGKNMVVGFANGIRTTTWLAVKASSSMAQETVNAAKEVFDEHSPSRVFAEIGMYAVKGLAEGLLDNANLSKNAAAELGDSAIEGLKSTIQTISDIVNSDIDTQPTIRPVLDLSDVKSGTATLNAMFSRTQAMKASAGMLNNTSDEIQNGDNTPKTGNSYQFVQNNYSPKALSRTEIYRQTRNQFTAMKGVLG